MAQPTRYEQHVNKPLTDISVAYIQDEDVFVHAKVFPEVPVKKQSDRYFVYTKDYWFRTVAAKRAPATQSVGTGYRIDNTPNYFCDVWAVHHDIPIEDYENYDDPLDPEADATELVTRNLLLRKEKLFMAQYMSTNIWQGFLVAGSPTDFAPNTSGGGFWDSPTSTPIADIDKLKASIQSITGYVPNRLVLAQNVFYVLRNHPSVQDRIKYTQRGVIAQSELNILADLFGVEQVLVAGAVVNNALEGAPASMAFMATNSFLLCYAAPAPSLRKPSAGYVFNWTGRGGAGAFGNTIESWYMQEIKAWRIEGEMSFQMAQVGKDLGVYGTNVLQAP